MFINGEEFEYGDLKVSMLGVVLGGLRGLVYKESQEKEAIGGQGNNPRAIQKGEKSYSGSLHLLQSDVDFLENGAKAAGYKSLIDVPGNLINIVATYKKDNVDTTLTVDSCINVEFTEVERGMRKGDKFKEVSLPFVFLQLNTKRI